MTTNELVTQLRYYRKCYYDGNPVVSDDIFDQMEKELEKIDPTNTYFNEIGYLDRGVGEIRKIKHVIPMKSMAKVKNPDDAVKWFHNTMSLVENPSNILYYEAKIDGNAGSLVYNENGNLKYVLSRGDGNEGLEIPQGFNFKNIPHKFIPNGEIRGEFYISKKDAGKVNGPLRNVCSGILKRKEETPEMDLIRFVMYDYFDHKNGVEFKNRKDKIDKLRSILPPGGDVIDIMVGTNIHLMYDRYINDLRNRWDYETDGIILTIEGDQSTYDTINSNYNVENHNKYNLALKPPAEEGISVIRDIKLNVSKNGRIVPVAVIDPTQICGVTISMVTLDNFSYVTKNRINIGSEIVVKRSNDVIPKIVSVRSQGNKAFRVKNCPCCGSEVETRGVDIFCPNRKCPERLISKVLNMLNIFGVKNVGERYVRMIVNWMRSSGRDMSLSEFVGFVKDMSGETDTVMEELFGSSTRKENIKSALQSMFNHVTELDLIDCVSIPGIGRKTLEKLKIRNKADLIGYIKNKQNCQAKTAIDLILHQWYTDDVCVEELDNLIDEFRPYIVEDALSTGTRGEVCLSGSFDIPKSVIKDALITKGFDVTDNVTKNTSYLITDVGGTSKTVKAKKFGIPIYTLKEFMKTIGG